MENELVIFEQRELLGKHFRIYGDIENPIFLAKDVAEWIEHSNVSVMLSNVDEDEKKLIEISTVNNAYGRNANLISSTWFLTEDGLYEVLMQSRKPIAKQFKKEVKEVLKYIRKTGKYEVNPNATRKDNCILKIFNSINDLDRIDALKEFEQIVASETAKPFIAKIAENQPKVDFANTIGTSQGTLSINEFAKVVEKDFKGLGRNTLFSVLRNKEILTKQDNNKPYQRYILNGCFGVTEVVKNGYTFSVTRITGKGQDMVYKLLRKTFPNGKVTQWGNSDQNDLKLGNKAVDKIYTYRSIVNG